MQREERELEKKESERALEKPQTDYPDVTPTPDEKETRSIPETPEPEPEPELTPTPEKAGWWGKLINKIPFFKSPQRERTSS